MEAENRKLRPQGKNSGSTRNQLWIEDLGKEIPRKLMDVLPFPSLQLLVKIWKDAGKGSPSENWDTVRQEALSIACQSENAWLGNL